jgi:hypothetical protein
MPVLAVDFFTGILTSEISRKPPAASAGGVGKEYGRLFYCLQESRNGRDAIVTQS